MAQAGYSILDITDLDRSFKTGSLYSLRLLLLEGMRQQKPKWSRVSQFASPRLTPQQFDDLMSYCERKNCS